jgi:hypothetical protein
LLDRIRAVDIVLHEPLAAPTPSSGPSIAYTLALSAIFAATGDKTQLQVQKMCWKEENNSFWENWQR